MIGLFETDGRGEIAKLAEGLEIIPKRRQGYHGLIVEEMDVGATLACKLQVALINELAHANVSGSPNPKNTRTFTEHSCRKVITTMNVQHFESLYNIVEYATGVNVRERLPDSILVEAKQVIDVETSSGSNEDVLRFGGAQ